MSVFAWPHLRPCLRTRLRPCQRRRRRGRLPGPHTSAPLPTTTTPPGTLHSPATSPAAPGNRTQLPPPGCAQQPHAAGHPPNQPHTRPARHSPANLNPAGQSTAHLAGRLLGPHTSARQRLSHQQRWCAKPARPAPAQPSGAAQGR